MCSEIAGWIKRYDELWRETNVLYEEWAKRRRISYHELLALLSISSMEGNCTQKSICEQWAFPKQTIHSILQSFLKRGLIVFVPLERDRRNKSIAFTEAGRAFAQPILEELHEKERAAWQRLGEEKSKALLETTALYNRFFREADLFENL